MNMIILGDANLCSKRWHSSKFPNKKVANALLNTLARCGLKIADVGPTLLLLLLLFQSCVGAIANSRAMGTGM